jgi:hypothetical protein
VFSPKDVKAWTLAAEREAKCKAMRLAPLLPGGTPDLDWARAFYAADPFTKRMMLVMLHG